MERKWTKTSELLPAPYKTVLITDDSGVSFKRAYRTYSEKAGNLWIDADKECDFYYLYEYPEWCYEN